MKAGVKYVAEGANMPSEADAIKVYHENKMLFGPAKVCLPLHPAHGWSSGLGSGRWSWQPVDARPNVWQAHRSRATNTVTSTLQTCMCEPFACVSPQQCLV